MAFFVAGRLNFHREPTTGSWFASTPKETVNVDDYQNLLRRFCEQERLDSDQLLREGVLTLDGRRVAIHFEPEISAHHILARAELGALLEDLAPGCWRSMLQANYQWGHGGTVFSLQPGSLEAILTDRIPVQASTTPSELRQAFDTLAAVLRHWTDTLEDLQHLVSTR